MLWVLGLLALCVHAQSWAPVETCNLGSIIANDTTTCAMCGLGFCSANCVFGLEISTTFCVPAPGCAGTVSWATGATQSFNSTDIQICYTLSLPAMQPDLHVIRQNCVPTELGYVLYCPGTWHTHNAEGREPFTGRRGR